MRAPPPPPPPPAAAVAARADLPAGGPTSGSCEKTAADFWQRELAGAHLASVRNARVGPPLNGRPACGNCAQARPGGQLFHGSTGERRRRRRRRRRHNGGPVERAQHPAPDLRLRRVKWTDAASWARPTSQSCSASASAFVKARLAAAQAACFTHVTSHLSGGQIKLRVGPAPLPAGATRAPRARAIGLRPAKSCGPRAPDPSSRPLRP